MTVLHRVKERKSLSLSDKAVVTHFPEGGVVWKIPYWGIINRIVRPGQE